MPRRPTRCTPDMEYRALSTLYMPPSHSFRIEQPICTNQPLSNAMIFQNYIPESPQPRKFLGIYHRCHRRTSEYWN